MLVGVIIFASAVCDIDWTDYTEATPVMVTCSIMPFTRCVAQCMLGASQVRRMQTHLAATVLQHMPVQCTEHVAASCISSPCCSASSSMSHASCSNIAYGLIGGIAAYIFCKFFTYGLFKFQEKWPGGPS